MKKTYYLLYKITNLLNGMIYIGIHKTQNKNDNYMGSGKKIKLAIKKHGIENFKKIILKECFSHKELSNLESQVVNEDFLKRKDVYNLALGGLGGNGKNSKGKITARDLVGNYFQVDKNDPRIGKTLFFIWKGKKHSKETKRKIGKANSISVLGIKNGSYGTMWITNESENRKVSKDLKKLPKGFRKGRVYSKEILNKFKSIDRSGEKSSCFGKMWITNSIENKLIKKDSKIPNGFRKGRIFPPEFGIKMSLINKGKILTEETKAKIKLTLSKKT